MILMLEIIKCQFIEKTLIRQSKHKRTGVTTIVPNKSVATPNEKMAHWASFIAAIASKLFC